MAALRQLVRHRETSEQLPSSSTSVPQSLPQPTVPLAQQQPPSHKHSSDVMDAVMNATQRSMDLSLVMLQQQQIGMLQAKVAMLEGLVRQLFDVVEATVPNANISYARAVLRQQAQDIDAPKPSASIDDVSGGEKTEVGVSTAQTSSRKWIPDELYERWQRQWADTGRRSSNNIAVRAGEYNDDEDDDEDSVCDDGLGESTGSHNIVTATVQPTAAVVNTSSDIDSACGDHSDSEQLPVHTEAVEEKSCDEREVPSEMRTTERTVVLREMPIAHATYASDGDDDDDDDESDDDDGKVDADDVDWTDAGDELSIEESSVRVKNV